MVQLADFGIHFYWPETPLVAIGVIVVLWLLAKVGILEEFVKLFPDSKPIEKVEDEGLDENTKKEIMKYCTEIGRGLKKSGITSKGGTLVPIYWDQLAKIYSVPKKLQEDVKKILKGTLIEVSNKIQNYQYKWYDKFSDSKDEEKDSDGNILI